MLRISPSRMGRCAPLDPRLSGLRPEPFPYDAQPVVGGVSGEGQRKASALLGPRPSTSRIARSRSDRVFLSEVVEPLPH